MPSTFIHVSVFFHLFITLVASFPLSCLSLRSYTSVTHMWVSCPFLPLLYHLPLFQHSYFLVCTLFILLSSFSFAFLCFLTDRYSYLGHIWFSSRSHIVHLYSFLLLPWFIFCLFCCSAHTHFSAWFVSLLAAYSALVWRYMIRYFFFISLPSLLSTYLLRSFPYLSFPSPLLQILPLECIPQSILVLDTLQCVLSFTLLPYRLPNTFIPQSLPKAYNFLIH